MFKTSTWSELSKLISTKRQRDSLQFHVSCFGLVILSGFVWTLTVRGYECIDGDIDHETTILSLFIVSLVVAVFGGFEMYFWW